MVSVSIGQHVTCMSHDPPPPADLGLVGEENEMAGPVNSNGI